MPKRRIFLISSAMASFITPFISVAVNVALPAIARSFNVSITFVNWFINIFLISMASTILLFGIIADWLSREIVFITGLLTFTLAAFLVPYINNFTFLLILASIQGLGTAMISGTAVAILVNLFPDKTGSVIGLNTAAIYLGTTLGPALGGFLVDYAGWTSLFILTSIIALISTILALTSIDITKKIKNKKPYIPTLSIFTISTLLVTFGSTYIEYTYGLTALFLGLTTFILTLYTENKKHLNLTKQIFEKRRFLAYITTLLNYIATFSLTILFSNYLQLKVGFTAREAGLILLAQPLSQMLLSPIAGHLADKTNPGLLVTIGMSLITLGIGTSIITYKWINLLITSLILLGIGFAFFASPNTTQIMRGISKEAFASASSFLGLMRFLGQSLSTSTLIALALIFKTATAHMEITLITYMTIAIIATITAATSTYKK